jgi:peptidoglycan/LPS O-acetylase OafA/YrhL
MTLTIWKGVSNLGGSGTKRFSGSIKFLISFYARRIRRLAPAATVCLLAILITVQSIGSFKLILETTPQVFASAVFLQNWFLADQAVDYLGAGSGATAVQHFWSLSVEEQFYLTWPLLLLIVGLIGFAVCNHSRRDKPQRDGVSKASVTSNVAQNWRPCALPIVFISVFTIASFAYCLLITSTNPAEAYFVTPARIWELSLGGVIVFLPIIKHRDLRLLLPYFGLALITCPFIIWDGIGFPGWHALVPTFGTALIIWAGGKEDGSDKPSRLSITSLARIRPLQFFGDISYSLYLWHWPLIVLVPFALDADLNASSFFKVAILLASIMVAWISYKLIESLPDRLEKRSKRPTRVLVSTWVSGAVCLAMILTPSIVMKTHAQEYTDHIVKRAFERAMDPNDIGFGARATQHLDQYPNPYGQTDREWAQFASVSFSGTWNYPDTFARYDSDPTGNTPSNAIGEFGDTSSARVILFIGDSYSQQWYPAIDIAARNLGYRVIAAPSINAGGGMFELENESGDIWHQTSGTEKSITRANDRFCWIRDHLWAQADIVIIGVSPGYFSQAGTTPENSVGAPQKLAQTIIDIETVTGRKPILLQSQPQISNYNNQTSYIDRQDKESSDTNEYMDRIYNLLIKTDAWNSFEYLRIESLFMDENGISHTQVGGVPVYFDSYFHINTLYSASAGEYFTEQLREFIS